jgi:quinol monooxygenase YgiN
MIVALGDVYALLPRRQEAIELMRETQAAARSEPGCLGYAFPEAVDDPGHFVLVQQWRDQSALDAHYRSDAFATYQARVGDLLVRTSDLRLHRVAETVAPRDSAPMDPRLAD